MPGIAHYPITFLFVINIVDDLFWKPSIQSFLKHYNLLFLSMKSIRFQSFFFYKDPLHICLYTILDVVVLFGRYHL